MANTLMMPMMIKLPLRRTEPGEAGAEFGDEIFHSLSVRLSSNVKFQFTTAPGPRRVLSSGLW